MRTKFLIQTFVLLGLSVAFLPQSVSAQIDLGYRSAEGGKALGEMIFGKPEAPVTKKSALIYKKELSSGSSWFGFAPEGREEIAFQSSNFGAKYTEGVSDYMGSQVFAYMVAGKDAEISIQYDSEQDMLAKEIVLSIAGSTGDFSDLHDYVIENLNYNYNGGRNGTSGFSVRLPIPEEKAEALSHDTLSSAEKLTVGVRPADKDGYELVMIISSSSAKTTSVVMPMLPIEE